MGAGSGGSILCKASKFFGNGSLNTNGGNSNTDTNPNRTGLAGEGSGGNIMVINIRMEKNIPGITYKISTNKGSRILKNSDSRFLGTNGSINIF